MMLRSPSGLTVVGKWGAVRLLLVAFLCLVPGNLLWGANELYPPGTLILTQLPLQAASGDQQRMVPDLECDGARIVLVRPGGNARVLTAAFNSACDPNISFDAKRMLFTAKRTAGGPWNIFEMDLADMTVNQITDDEGDSRQPLYQGSLYTIVSDQPWHQYTFVSRRAGELNEHDRTLSSSLYTCKQDGSEVRRLTFNPSSDLDPTLLPDGRLLFSSWRRGTLEHGLTGRVSLFASHTDGLDYALFSGDEGRPVKLMPTVGTDRHVYFVESDVGKVEWDGAGTLGTVSLLRNLHSYRPVTTRQEGLYHSPSALPDGLLAVSRRPADGSGSHAVYRFDPQSGQSDPLFDDPDFHDIQATLVVARPEPDGRSSVINEQRSTGVLYCLDINQSDFADPDNSPYVAAKRLRVLEGIPELHGAETAQLAGSPRLLKRRVLGEIPIEKDGSFNIEIPVNIPVQLQLVGDDGLAIRSCDWLWVRNRESRGCIGCHEDGETTPINRLVDAFRQESVKLTPPVEARRTVDFRRDVMPIIAATCSAAACHGGETAHPALTGSLDPGGGVNDDYLSLLGGYVHPGRARTSPLIWHLLGKRPAYPWDANAASQDVKPIPPGAVVQLTAEEVRTFVEWVDLGALWEGVTK
jgi:hypothetical protein